MTRKTSLRSNYVPHNRVGLKFTKPTLAKQSFKAECDINTIMAKYAKSGLVTHVNEHQGQYGDFIGYNDYHTSMIQIKKAEEMFLSLPAKMRAKFFNSPSEFLAFTQDPDNQEKMIELGLATRRPESPNSSSDDPNGVPTPRQPKQDADASPSPD